MNEYGTRINQIIYHFDDKENKKLQTDIFLRLCNKVGEENAEINTMISDTFSLLSDLDNNRDIKRKSYSKSLNLLKSTVRKKLGYTHKGALQEEYTGIGIAIGVALGTAFVNITPAAIGFGLPIGLAIGVTIGKKKESEAEAAGNTY